MSTTSLERRRAAHALAAIEAMKQHADIGHYVSYVKGLPAAILQSGLGQALGTLAAGAELDKDASKLKPDALAKCCLYKQVLEWLVSNHEDAPYRDEKDVWKAITERSETDYVHAQVEALAYLTWLKKFAVAFLEESDEEGRL